MFKLNKGVNLRLSIYCLLFIELLIIFWNVDILPFLVISLTSGGVILYNYLTIYKDDDTVDSSDFLHKSTKKENIIFLFLILLTILLFSLICFIDNKLVGELLLGLLNNSIYIRFMLYGIIYPIIFSYFVTWTYTDIKPIHPDNLIIYSKILFVSACVGLLVCIFWEKYSFIMLSF